MLAGLAALADDHTNCPFAGAAHHVQLEGVTGSGLERADTKQSLTWTAVTGHGKKRIAPPPGR